RELPRLENAVDRLEDGTAVVVGEINGDGGDLHRRGRVSAIPARCVKVFRATPDAPYNASPFSHPSCRRSMLFNSWVFLLFYPVVYATYGALRGWWTRKAALLVAGYVFYGWW